MRIGFRAMGLAHRFGLFWPLTRAGFIDSDFEGGPAYWRADFWNSNHRRLLKEPLPVRRRRELERRATLNHRIGM